MTDVTRPNGDMSDESGESDKSDDGRKGASSDTGKGTGTGIGTGTGMGTGTGTGMGTGTERREATAVTPIPRQADRQADTAAPVHAPEPPPAPVAADKRHDRLGSGDGSLLPHDESDKFNLRLQHAVTGFVDEPRAAVEEADHVLEEVAKRFTEAVGKRRDTLHSSWESKGSEDTERLRLALRDYRELTERLLHI